jgi:ribosomal protein S2
MYSIKTAPLKMTSINNLLKIGIHLGQNPNQTTIPEKKIFSYDKKRVILNLNEFQLSLLKFKPILVNILLNKKKILFISPNDMCFKSTQESALKCNQLFLRWVPGAISNYSLFTELQNGRELGDLNIGRPKPFIAFLPAYEIDIINELNNHCIPFICIVNSNNQYLNVTYPIFGNDKSLIAIHLYNTLISMFIKKIQLITNTRNTQNA